MTSRGIFPATTVAASPDLLATEFDAEVVLLNLRDGVYYGLDEVGARIWALLQMAPITMGAICDALEAEYDVARTQCEPDVRGLLEELAAKGLVEIRDDA